MWSQRRSILHHFESSEREKSLEFGMVEVFEFPAALGDNPYVSSGCPISIDWESEYRTVYGVDYYEDNFKGRRSRSRETMELSVSDRAEILLGAGYSLDDIANATLEAESTKRARRETNKNAIVELTWRNLRKILKPRTALAKSA